MVNKLKRSNEIPKMESRILFKNDIRLKEPVIIKNGKYLPPNDWYNNYNPNWIIKLIDNLLYTL